MWARLSIATKLPLALVALLSLVFGGMIVVAYLQVRTAIVGVASERLHQAAQHMAELLATSARNRIAALQNAADRLNVADYLTDPSPARTETVRAGLNKQVSAANPTSTLEIWDLTPRKLVAVGLPWPDSSPMASDEAHAGAGSTVGEYYAIGSTVAYNIQLPIKREGQLVGYVIERRRLANQPQTFSVLTGFIGHQATMILWNASGGFWTDLSTPIAGPTTNAAAVNRLLEYERLGRGPVFARTASVRDTPWLVAVEFARDPVLQPAKRFLYQAGAVSLLLIAVGAAAGSVLSRRITVPLRLVTHAAEALAASHSAARIPVTRTDEVGRLATSFNAMAEQVELSRRRLETLIKELEIRVEDRTAALQATNRELEAFSYSVSHDLRAPVRIIDGFARILREDHGPELSGEAQRCIDVIVKRTKEMGQLIDDLLTFSRLGRHPVTRGPVDMTALAGSVADEAKSATAPERDLAITVQPLPPADGERGLIKQVLANLVENAVKFTRTRVMPRVEIGATDQNGEIVYFVRDNGVGFDMRYADKLFGVFQRLHPASEFDGTGVGLAIVQRIVHRHGGRVWAHGVIDGGATFSFTLAAPSEPGQP